MSQIAHRLPYISKAIWNKAGDLDAPIAKPKQSRCGSARGIAKCTNIPDEVVLHIRRLHELECWTSKRIVGAFPQYSKTWLRNVMNYELRQNLRVQP